MNFQHGWRFHCQRAALNITDGSGRTVGLSDRRTVGPSAGATAFVIYCHCSDLGIHLVEDFSDAHGCAWDLPKEVLKCCVQFCGMFLQKSH